MWLDMRDADILLVHLLPMLVAALANYTNEIIDEPGIGIWLGMWEADMLLPLTADVVLLTLDPKATVLLAWPAIGEGDTLPPGVVCWMILIHPGSFCAAPEAQYDCVTTLQAIDVVLTKHDACLHGEPAVQE